MTAIPNRKSQVYVEIEHHIPQLQRYAQRLARERVAADDLLQESLERALSNSHRFKEGTNLRAWLFTILHNLHISEKRREQRIGFPVELADAGLALSEPPRQEQNLIVRALQKALNRLPRQQMEAIRMVAIEGRGYEEVAATLELPVGTLKSRISRGRQSLKRMIRGERARQASLQQKEERAVRYGVRDAMAA